LVEVTTFWELSTATQRLVLGHETPSRSFGPFTVVFVQAVAPPDGFVEVNTLPPPTATHRPVPMQEMPNKEEFGSTSVSVHAGTPPAGFVEVTTLPSVLQPPAMQRPLLGHVTVFNEYETLDRVHAAPPPVGLVEVMTWPSWSTATQRLVFGHDTPVRTPEPLTWALLQTEAGAGRLVGEAVGAGDAAGGVAIWVGEGLETALGVLTAVAVDSRGDGAIDPVALPQPDTRTIAARKAALILA
jgi:hypothetical protein